MSDSVNISNRTRNNWIASVDRILRGEATTRSELFRDNAKEPKIRIPMVGLSIIIGGMAAVYGLMLATFALIRGIENGQMSAAICQVTANLFKVPLLFVLALVITFPSLYVFSALVGCPIRIRNALRLLVASLAVTISVLASLGPIVAFFAVCSPNYHFIVLLNVVVFSIAGILGLRFLIHTLRKMNSIPVAATIVQRPTENVPQNESEPDAVIDSITCLDSVSNRPEARSLSPTASASARISVVFWCWMLAFGLVGAQLGWILRPFVGAPNLPFQWFRKREGNFFSAVFDSLFQSLGSADLDSLLSSLF